MKAFYIVSYRQDILAVSALCNVLTLQSDIVYMWMAQRSWFSDAWWIDETDIFSLQHTRERELSLHAPFYSSCK